MRRDEPQGIEGDDSFGVHNPRFARTVLLATLDALK